MDRRTFFLLGLSGATDAALLPSNAPLDWLAWTPDPPRPAFGIDLTEMTKRVARALMRLVPPMPVVEATEGGPQIGEIVDGFRMLDQASAWLSLRNMETVRGAELDACASRLARIILAERCDAFGVLGLEKPDGIADVARVVNVNGPAVRGLARYDEVYDRMVIRFECITGVRVQNADAELAKRFDAFHCEYWVAD